MNAVAQRVVRRGHSQQAGTIRRAALRAGMATALLAPLAAGCGTGGQRRAAPAPTSATPVTLRWAASAIAAQASRTYDEARVRSVEAFNTRQSAVQVSIEWRSGIVQAVLAQVAGGDPPDLVHAHPRDTNELINSGAALELDSYLRREKRNVPDIIPSVLDYWLRDGRRYALPNNWSPQAIYFNKGLFDKHGLKTPDQHEKEGKWTFDVYLELARKLTSGTGEQKVWGAPWTTSNLDIQLAFIWPFGGDMWDKAAQQTLLDSKESVEAIQFQADLARVYGVSPAPDEVRQLPRAVGGALAIERGGMEILTTDVLGLLTPTTFPKGMAPMPKGRAGRIVRGAPIGVHIMRDSKHRDAAWEAANYQTGLETARLMLEWRLAVPWLRSLLNSPEHSKALLPWESAAAYQETVNKVRPTFYPNQFAQINRLYVVAYNSVRDGQKTAQQAMGEIRVQVNELLRQR